VTSPSRLLARDIERAGWLRDRRVEIVRYPVDLEPWSGRDSADIAPPRVLVVGRLEARKAPEIVIRAAALLSSEVAELEVVFIGRSSLRNGGSYREWLADLAAELGVACRFIEHVDRVRMPEWYSRARAVVVASRYDNFPYAGLEAMASARPLVCSRSTGMAEILDGSRGGVVVDVDDHRAIATALRPYLLDGAVAARAGREARELVERVCSPDRIAEEREACFQEAIARWTRRQGRNARQQAGR
jgi:glycosyltransferase involved in cell wall biosynthesis